MSKPSHFPPLTAIGEADWVAKLTAYLADRNIPVAGERPDVIAAAEHALELPLPPDVKAYYQHFGQTSSSDYLYTFKPAAELARLFALNITFVSLNFRMSELAAMVQFAESPGGDPLCFDFQTGAIYLFSHDPLCKAKVFATFSQYVLHELLETERLVGHQPLSATAAARFAAQYLAGDGIDYRLREMKL